MKSLVLDPLPLLHLSDKITYNRISDQLKALPKLEVLPKIVDPVERNEFENQLLEKSSNLRVRMSPSTKGTILGYLKPNVYYNYLEIKNADGYDWYKIADKEWVAKTETMVVFPKQSEIDVLKEEIKKLEAEKEDLTARIETSQETIAKLETEKVELEKEKSSLGITITKLNTRISEAIRLLTK